MFDAISKASGLLKRLYKLKDDVEFLEAVAPLQEAINDAQREATEAISKIHSLTVENTELKVRIKESESKKVDREKYSVFKTEYGAVALKLKEGMSDGYPLVCANCFENDQISPLHEDFIYWRCKGCSSEIQFKDAPSVRFS